jgi:predicted enzyme related to lactoylglutathione lyase
MPRPIHFEIPADDPDRASKFYEAVFGWEISKWDGPMEYWITKTGTGPGIDGGLMRRQHPGQGTVNTMDVASVDDAVKTIEANGGKLVVPKMPIPAMGWLAYCTDTEGNTFGLMQMDKNAK